MNIASDLRRRDLLVAASALPLAAWPAAGAVRRIDLDLARARQPLDRFFNDCVGSDYPGTLHRPDTLAQLKTAVDELGFRQLRFHAIFRDVLKTVSRDAQGQLVFDFDGVDRLYDALLERRIRPLLELGFTPKALATSDNKIFWWQGNTSHPRPDDWVALVDAFVRHLLQRYGEQEVRQWQFELSPSRDGIRKPVWFAYKYLAALRGLEVPVSDPSCWAAASPDGLRAVIWDWRDPDQKVGNRSFFGKPQPAHDLAPVPVSLRGVPAGRYRLSPHRTGHEANDAHTAWLKMGEPKDLAAAQLQRLQDLTRDLPESRRDVRIGKTSRFALELRLRTHDVVQLRLERVGA